MKTRTLAIKAQHICKEATEEVFVNLVSVLSNLEKDNLFQEEPVVALLPYNNGYQIRIDTVINYNHPRYREFPAIFISPFIQPTTWFEEDLEKGNRTYIEFGWLKPDRENHSSDRTAVSNLGQFKTFATAWVEGMKKQIEELNYKF